MTPRTDHGFTLLETLIAVFALALLMGAGSTLLVTTLNSNRLIDERLDRLGKLEVATAHIRSDLEHAVPRLAESPLASVGQQSLFGGPPDRFRAVLGMVRDGWQNLDNEADRGDLLSVIYRVEDGTLFREVYERPDRARATPGSRKVLVDGLADLRVRFVDAGIRSDRWTLSQLQGLPRLPEAVEVEMTFETGERMFQMFLVGGRP